jgi:broad specificity phosphatase PhoE
MVANDGGKCKIFAIRHGQSVWNVLHSNHPSQEERYHPRMWTVDCDITNIGVQQAKQAGENLGAEISSIDLVIISPLRRALQTASLLLENFPAKPSQILISKDAAEVMVDPCDIGSSPKKLAKEFPKWDFSHLSENWWNGGLTQDETLAQMKDSKGLETEEDAQTRIEALKSFLRSKDGGNVVVVCHSDTIWWLTRREKDGDQWGLRVDNGEVVDITSYIHFDKD